MEQEIDFYSIALAKLLQTTPELGTYIVSFTDVTEELNNDSGIKVGVFILRVGVDLFFIPVVSKTDNVYPIDSVFIQSISKFMPLTKRVIEMIIHSSQLTQGKGTKIPSTVNQNPDVTAMINPPRTGKFTYASTSRLADFLASMPSYLKDFTLEKISAERSAYENLHRMFSIRDIFTALKTPTKSLAGKLAPTGVSVVTGMSPEMGEEVLKGIMERGYHVSGSHPVSRVAVTEENFHDFKFTQVSNLDGDKDYEVVLCSASTREAFIPKKIDMFRPITIRDYEERGSASVALFTSGDYAISNKFVVVGEPIDRKTVLENLFSVSPPILMKELEVGDKFALLNTDSELLGVFCADRVTLSNLGVVLKVSALGGVDTRLSTINAYLNYGGAPTARDRDIYVPYDMLAIKLNNNISQNVETDINRAHKGSKFKELAWLGDQIDLSYDNVEFCINGKPVATEAEVMSKLAVDQGLDPDQVTTFIKQAKDKKYTRIYLSKQAGDLKPSEIPEFGNKPAPTPKTGLNGSFMPNVQSSLQTRDAQTVEATIISELLQAPDMLELVEEYMPDIAECLDKLGRTLFLSRIHINQLSGSNDVDSIFAFLASLKATYRMLGDNYSKLQELIALKPDLKK